MKRRMLALAMLATMSAAPVLAASGEQAGPPIVVDGVYGATVLDTHVSATADGFSVMVWTVENAFTGQRELKMLRLASWGDPIGAPITVAGPSLGLSHPRVAIAPNRNALVVWQEDAVDGDGSAILARAYDGASGLPRDNAFVVNQTTVGDQRTPTITMDRQGNHAVILWDTPAAEGGHAAMARAFTSWGTPLCAGCNEFRLNTDASPNPTRPAAHVNTWGEVRAFWLGREYSGALFDRILSQKFFWDGSAITTTPEVWGASLFNPADISEFSVAENESEQAALAFSLAGNVYTANAPFSAFQVFSSGSQCSAPRLANHVFAGQGLAMNCDLGVQRLPYVALSSFGPFAPNVIADNVLPPYAPGTIAVGGFATDTDGNGILTASLPAGVYGYDSSAAVFRVRGLTATAMAVTVTGDTPVSSGAELVYTVAVSNQGPTSAIPHHHELKGLELVLSLPAGTSLINAGGGGWTCSNAVPVQCKFADVLPPQQQSELTIRTTGLSAPATATLQASLTSIVNSTPTVATGSASIDIANADQSPDPFTLPSYQSVPRMTYYLEQVTISGIDTPTPISIKNGRYAINNGRFTSVDGLVSNGDTVQVEHYAAGTFSTTQSTHLTVGDVTASLTTTTEAEDTSVTPFDLVDVSNVPRNSVQTSNAIEVQGINTAVAISVIGGSYSINDGGFGNLPGIVQPGDSVVVRHVAASNFATATNTTLTIGDQTAVFTTVTEFMDTTPDAFSFIDQSNLATNVETTSAPITVTGINAGAVISISGGSYSVNGGAFVTAAGIVQANDVVRARVRTAATANTAISANITIGGVTDTFSATTGASDTTPDGFNFTDQTGVRRNRPIVSNAVSIAGINTAVPISISGNSSALYSKNGGAYTATPGTVVKGDQIRLQIQSSAAANTTSSVTVTIGGVEDVWRVTTGNR